MKHFTLILFVLLFAAACNSDKKQNIPSQKDSSQKRDSITISKINDLVVSIDNSKNSFIEKPLLQYEKNDNYLYLSAFLNGADLKLILEQTGNAVQIIDKEIYFAADKLYMIRIKSRDKDSQANMTKIYFADNKIIRYIKNGTDFNDSDEIHKAEQALILEIDKLQNFTSNKMTKEQLLANFDFNSMVY